MTHPDILKMERDGCLDYPNEPKYIGDCLYCNHGLYDDYAHCESRDGMFCDLDCCHAFYNIEEKL